MNKEEPIDKRLHGDPRLSTSLLVLAALCWGSGGWAMAQSAASPAPASLAVPAAATSPEPAYRSCPGGYYLGARPGRTQYIKDDYFWVVTPEFAATYCMPPEFISTELKGAEAIAYKPVFEGAENCGFGGQREACGRRMAHGLEIYYKSSLRLPGISDTKYSYRAVYMLPITKHLVADKGRTELPKFEYWTSFRPGIQIKFEGWGLLGIKDDRPIWPVAPFREVQYIEEMTNVLSYLSLEGTVGNLSNPRFEKLGLNKFVLVLDKSGEKRDDTERNIQVDYGHVIHLPSSLLEKIRAVDKRGDGVFKELLRKAFPAMQH